jgi:hypothetical protein
MPYYKDANLLFIHIPKTGGTSLESYLLNKYNQTIHDSDKNKIIPIKKRVFLQHYTYGDIYKHRQVFGLNFDDKLNIITIVRNPYDRIISDMLYLKLINRNDTLDKIYNVIKNKYLYEKDLYNHNIPQYKFIIDENENIIPNLKIFKTETLTKEIKEYGFEDYDGQNNSTDYSKYLNNDSIKLINKYYKTDFDLFGYDMKKTGEDDDNYEYEDEDDGATLVKVDSMESVKTMYSIEYFDIFRYIIIFILIMYLIYGFLYMNTKLKN